jgi:hypothetical protein
MVYLDDDVPAVLLPVLVVQILLLPILLLLIEVLDLEVVSCAALVTSLEFCSNVFAALAFRLNICFELSLTCCITDFIESRLENMILFVVLITTTALSATLLTNLLYALATV